MQSTSLPDRTTTPFAVIGLRDPIPETGGVGAQCAKDLGLTPGGVKTSRSDKKVTRQYLDMHLRIGIDSLKQLINNGETVKHLKF